MKIFFIENDNYDIADIVLSAAMDICGREIFPMLQMFNVISRTNSWIKWTYAKFHAWLWI